jgi:hypothetical protein
MGTTADPVERAILRTSFRYFWELAERESESSVRVRALHLFSSPEKADMPHEQKITEHLFRDNTDTDEDIWYKDFVPDVRPFHLLSSPWSGTQ